MLETIFSPSFLSQNLYTISLIYSAVILVLFSELVLKHVIFPISFYLKDITFKKRRKRPTYLKILVQTVATIIFILYCYFGSVLLARFIFLPILQEFRSIILVVIILSFIGLTYILHTDKIRKKFLRV
ncbi:MAG: hypothetical protein ACMXYA_00485 [Candidatus Woesearchaeota archaeon]